MALDYFYDGQLRQYIVQIVRAFSGFQVAFGKNDDGSTKFRIVPVTWASQDKQVAAIIGNNSENTMLSTPQMSCYITSIDMKPEMRQAPNHVDMRNVVEREIDPINNKYMATRGKSYTVERMMPVPFEATIQLDIWTTNEQQKHQILEQILVLFNPSIDLQANTNALDWTALTTLELKSINWSSRGIPIGTSTDIEISSLTFTLPLWLNPPAKQTRMRIIEQIVMNIGQLNSETAERNIDSDVAANNWSNTGDIWARDIITPENHCVLVDGNTITLLGANGSETDLQGNPYNFLTLFDRYYGKYTPGISKMRLKTNEDLDDIESDIVGAIEVDQEHPNRIYFTVDLTTLPQNNLPPIDGIIDPHKSWPQTNLCDAPPSPMPAPVIGHRYMVINPIVAGTVWGDLSANANDIIEYMGENIWSVVFDSTTIDAQHTVLNRRTGLQITWLNGQWRVTLAGKYTPGMWRISL